MEKIALVVLLTFFAPETSRGQSFLFPCPTVQEEGASATLSDFDPPFRLQKAQMADTKIYHPTAQTKIKWGVCGSGGCGTMTVTNLGSNQVGSTLYKIEFEFKEYITPSLQGDMICRH